ncbi:MAG: PQQ-binding-like beta-propeller repeat protein [Bryobacteraceae bacterium]
MNLRAVRCVCIPLLLFSPVIAANWLSYGNDPQRTSWSPEETDITPENAKSLTMVWKAHLDNQPRELNSLTAPVNVTWVTTDKGMAEIVIVGGASDNLFAIDADTGKLLWKKTFEVEGKPRQQPFWLCPNALNATPLIRKDGLAATVFSIASDGKLHALNAINGEDRMPPRQFVPPFSKNWSLNLVQNVLYTTTSQGCNGARSGVYALDLSVPDSKPVFYQAANGGAGIWGRAGAAVSKGGMVFAPTGDGTYDAGRSQFPDTILQLSAKDLKLVDYFTPSNHNYLTRKDLDMGCASATVFPMNGKEVVAIGGKEGVLYLLDAEHVGGPDHKTPLFRSPVLVNEEADFAGRGFWGAFATALDGQKNRWLYAPALGPASQFAKFPVKNGDAPNGSIMAFRVVENDGKASLEQAWISRDMNLPEPPIVAGGVVFAISNGEFARQSKGTEGGLYNSAERAAKHVGNTVLYAFDATTGKELYSSGNTMPSWTHFSGISISGGKVFVTTFDSNVYAFGVKE